MTSLFLNLRLLLKFSALKASEVCKRPTTKRGAASALGQGPLQLRPRGLAGLCRLALDFPPCDQTSSSLGWLRPPAGNRATREPPQEPVARPAHPAGGAFLGRRFAAPGARSPPPGFGGGGGGGRFGGSRSRSPGARRWPPRGSPVPRALRRGARQGGAALRCRGSRQEWGVAGASGEAAAAQRSAAQLGAPAGPLNNGPFGSDSSALAGQE